MAITREQALQAKDLNTETVSVPEWGGDVIVKGMSGADRAVFLSSLSGENDFTVDAKLLVKCLVDDNGSPLFESAGEILSKNSQTIRKLAEVAGRLSGLSADSGAEAEKN